MCFGIFAAVLIPEDFELVRDFGNARTLAFAEVLFPCQPVEIQAFVRKLVDLAKCLGHDNPSFLANSCRLDARRADNLTCKMQVSLASFAAGGLIRQL